MLCTQKLYQSMSTLMNKQVDLWEVDDARHCHQNTAPHSSESQFGLNPVCAARLEMWFLSAAQWPVGQCLNAKPTAEWTGSLLAELNAIWEGLWAPCGQSSPWWLVQGACEMQRMGRDLTATHHLCPTLSQSNPISSSNSQVFFPTLLPRGVSPDRITFSFSVQSCSSVEHPFALQHNCWHQSCNPLNQHTCPCRLLHYWRSLTSPLSPQFTRINKAYFPGIG